MKNLLEVNNLSYSYNNNKNVFNDLQISIKKQTINLITGPNSCGKTTLIRLLSGILPSKKNIILNEMILDKKNINEYILSIGVVLYEDNNKLLFDNVLDELAFPLENLIYKKEDITNRIYEVRNIFGLQNIINKKNSDLTSFELVKVLIAKAIIHKPKIVFLDNILLNLNPQEIKTLFKTLNKIKKDITIIITSSSLRDILYFDNVIVLNDGKVAITGTSDFVLKKDNELSKIGLTIPPMIDLSLKLGFYGLLDEIITDVDGMVDKLWK